MTSNHQEDTQSTPHRVLALYKFVSPFLPKESLKDLQAEIETTCRKYRSRGTILLAEEGINGTICYPKNQEEEDPVLAYLQSKFDNSLRIRVSQADRMVFSRLRIKIKKEIVTMHQEDIHPTECVGMHVKPSKWNELLEDPECLVIDTRNEYEVQVGTFRNAVNPHTQHFTEFPEWMSQNLAAAEKQPPKKIAMFCTGGIRCEKATNACLQLIPKNVPVYHLEGGILAYLDSVQPEESLFDGECYVFDQRIAVTYGIKPSTKFSTSCRACRRPLSQMDLEQDDFVEGKSCRWCEDKLTEKQKERFAERQQQIELARQTGQAHIHDPKEILSMKQSV